MQFIKIAVLFLLAGGTIVASAATFTKAGVQTIDHPDGISLRQESVRTRRARFFPYYRRGRYHRGGGLSRGK
jgi:hypothetical protein